MHEPRVASARVRCVNNVNIYQYFQCGNLILWVNSKFVIISVGVSYIHTYVYNNYIYIYVYIVTDIYESVARIKEYLTVGSC